MDHRAYPRVDSAPISVLDDLADARVRQVLMKGGELMEGIGAGGKKASIPRVQVTVERNAPHDCDIVRAALYKLPRHQREAALDALVRIEQALGRGGA